MKKSISLLMLTIMALFSACSLHEQPEIDNGDKTARQIDLQISIPCIETRTRAIGAAEENAIKTIDVLAFKINGTSETFDYAVTGTNVGDATGANGSIQAFKVTVQIRDYPQRFVVITNASSAVSGVGTVGDNKADLLADLEVSLENGRWNAISAADYDALPMWGESAPETITSSSTELANPIQMLRMVAKVNVQLDQTTNVTDNFKLKSLHLYNTNDKGYIVPSPGNLTGGKATAPTVPGDATLTEGPIEYDDLTSPGEEDIAMRGAIYLFETAKEDAIADRLKATCVVIGGLYGSETDESYYRVDFLKDNNFMDILRNHQYTINITKISGKGHDTVDEAFRSRSVNMEAEVVYWDEGGVNVTDGQYILNVSDDEFVFYGFGRKLSGTDNILNVFTDHISGWSVEKIVDAADGTSLITWLRVSSDEGVANTMAPVSLLFDENDTGADRSAIIWFAAGRLRTSVTVTHVHTMATRFARSNIVWTGSKLTFAVTPEDNETIPASSQGVFFKGGSLVAISPAALSGVDASYRAGKYPAGHILFSPTNVYTYTSGNIPWIGTSVSSVIQDYFATYGGGVGYNASAGLGDICRYISDQTGWVNGEWEWRLPTSAEYTQFISEGSARGGIFGSLEVTPSGNLNTSGYGLNAYGFYQHRGGGWIGYGVTYESGMDNPTAGQFFPVSGIRDMSSSMAGQARWANGQTRPRSATFSPYDAAHFLYISYNSTTVSLATRSSAHSIRCIRDN